MLLLFFRTTMQLLSTWCHRCFAMDFDRYNILCIYYLSTACDLFCETETWIYPYGMHYNKIMLFKILIECTYILSCAIRFFFRQELKFLCLHSNRCQLFSIDAIIKKEVWSNPVMCPRTRNWFIDTFTTILSFLRDHTYIIYSIIILLVCLQFT